MKLLVIYPYLPYPLDRGTYQRTFHLLRELARAHEIDLLAFAENGDGTQHKGVFEQFCRRVTVVPFQHPPWPKLFPNRLLNPRPTHVVHWNLPVMRDAIALALKAETYEAVHVVDIVLAQYFLEDHRVIPLFIDRSRVDLLYQLAEHKRMKFPWRTRLLRCEGYMKLWHFERKIAKRATLEIVCGIDDERFIHKYISKSAPVRALINGVDIDYFQSDAVPDLRSNESTVLFCGAMDYNPNIDALRWYFESIHDALKIKIPDLQVLIVGKSPIDEVRAYGNKPGVTVTGGVPDVRPFYRRAWLQIVPLRIGGGSRLKIVESLAIGTPVVSTTIGAQGLGLVPNQDILLADEPMEFVRQTERALGDVYLRNQLEQRGLETVRARLSWKTIGKELCGIYREILPGRPETPK